MKRGWWLAAALILLLAAFAPFAGVALIASEPPVAADAIIVLAGNTPGRLPYAETLRDQGFARVLVVSNERVHTHGLETTWLEIHRAGFSAPDIPEADLAVMDPPPDSTIDEARRAADLLAARGMHSALLVTDAFHSRRAGLLFAAAFRHRGLSVRSTPMPDTFDLAHYWTHPLSARRVAEEYVKLAYYAATGTFF